RLQESKQELNKTPLAGADYRPGFFFRDES
ncbi:hypothetical protein AVDCRST_MAG84-4404, partial [uncultured Microcoleus sp.]